MFQEKLPLKSKLSFGGATFANTIMSQIAFAAITFYYNVKFGLSESFIAIAWIIFAAWNAINDPLFGFIEDKTKSKKYGRRIPYLRFGAPIYGFLFILVWYPLIGRDQMGLFINLVIILFAFDTIYTIIGLITYSLPAEMTVSSKSRANLMIYGSIFSTIGFLVSFTLPVLLLTGDKSTSVDPLFLIAMIILGIISALIIFASSFYIKENKYTQLEETLGIFEGLKETLKNKSFLIFEIHNFLFLLAQTILVTAVFYYITFILQLSGFSSILPLLIFFLMVLVFTPVYGKLVAIFGLKKTNITSLLITSIGFIVLFIIGWTFFTAIIALIMVGIGMSGIFLTSQAIFAETIDHDELKTGKRRETTYAGINALITKPAISIANFIFLAVIIIFGFQRASNTQSANAQLGIMIGFAAIPAIFILLSALAIKFFPLDGAAWNEQKSNLKKVHQEKEAAYLKQIQEQEKK